MAFRKYEETEFTYRSTKEAEQYAIGAGFGFDKDGSAIRPDMPGVQFKLCPHPGGKFIWKRGK